jgi:16S rRNA (uracil1498-N3)-methyltransferase
MKRFVISSPPNPDGMIRLYREDYHYLTRVKRLKAGMCFEAILPGGTETRVRILSTVDNILIGECLDGVEKQLSSLPPLALFQGLPKGSKMDLIVRQAAEAGVAEIVPFLSEYSIPQLKIRKNAHKTNPLETKITRWRSIIKEARQQSGSAVDTVIRMPVFISDIPAVWGKLKEQYSSAVGLALHQVPLMGMGDTPLEQASLHGYLDKRPELIAAAIGPEGGFSSSEVSGLLDAGFKPLTFGSAVLRTETAALYAIAAIQIVLLEYDSWEMSRK